MHRWTSDASTLTPLPVGPSRPGRRCAPRRRSSARCRRSRRRACRRRSSATIGVLAFTVVGAVILDRRPGEPVGRICLGVGLTYGVGHDPAPGVELHGSPARPDHADRRRPRGHRVDPRVARAAAERSAADQPLSRSSARVDGSVVSRTCSWRSSAWSSSPGQPSRASSTSACIDTVENPLGLDWIPSDADALFALDGPRLRRGLPRRHGRPGPSLPGRRTGRPGPDPLVRGVDHGQPLPVSS